MCKSIAHRGPDDHGTYITDTAALGFRRLSILDLSQLGHQPMTDESGRYIIVYNGEIYNYRELQQELLPDFKPKSHTDTEVLLQLFIRYRTGILDRLNGMFAFAVWDNEKNSLFIARDRLGVKPLYYTIYDGCLFFGSEIKALHAAGVPKIFAKEYMEELLCFRCIAGEATCYREIKKLLPGHYMTVEEGELKIQRWWQYTGGIHGEAHAQPENTKVWLRTTFDEAVKYRTLADVPVGVLLSGGMDSGSIAASLGLHGKGRINTFTVRFAEEKFDEGNLAKQVAERYDMRYNDLFVPPSEVYNLVREAIRFNDEPLQHASDPYVLAISRFARPKVTILLSGEGGDETLGGYVRYRPLKHKWLLAAGFILAPLLRLLPLRSRWAKLIRFLQLGSFDKFILYNNCQVLPAELKRLSFRPQRHYPYREKIVQESKEAYPDDHFRRVIYYDMHTHLSSLLQRNDSMTMAASIECRVPFLDYRLVETLGAMPTGKLIPDKRTKSLLRRALGSRLPDPVLLKGKWGFGVPWDKYYRTIPEFRNYVGKLADHPLAAEFFTEPEKLRKAAAAFLEGEEKYRFTIIQLTNICMWYDMNFDR